MGAMAFLTLGECHKGVGFPSILFTQVTLNSFLFCHPHVLVPHSRTLALEFMNSFQYPALCTYLSCPSFLFFLFVYTAGL